MNRKEILLYIFVAALLLIEFIIFKDLPFFWDGISKASRATWIYNTNFSSLILPTEYSSGHPPLWITSLAIFWKLFGQVLWSSRLLLLLINLGVFYQILIVCKRNFVATVPIFLFLLVCLDPTLVAQTTSLNNDMMLLFFTLLSFNALQKNRWLLYAFALTGLLLTNLRGIYCFVALILIHVIYNRKRLLVWNQKMIRSYCTATLCFVVFLIFQYTELGWVLITRNENFSKHREAVTGFSIIKNIAAFVKNILDFGRVFLWIPMVLFLLKYYKNKKRSLDVNSQKIGIALLVFTVVFFLGFVPFSNPMGPRYLMICYILAAILFINLLFTISIKKKIRNSIMILVTAGLISGHFWIYPATISQAWDSSLAYIGYFEKEEKMLNYLEEKKIAPSNVGTNLTFNGRALARLSKKDSIHENFSSLNLDTNQYVIFSNIENDTDDATIITLRKNWEEIKTFERLGVFITLYKSPKTKSFKNQ
ncbi:hypothetical protein [Marixanthomonas ophiurae]|uniref:Uncharacterized protein n=1 Tax=Marixanthomonas ophiurae TaxID=387659 RepID=A0A3E1Q860_9FLAO|nr:hypothetical protein [Marixanthomonas ophiurae]RFN58323.1 hypothetical protein DZ858_13950 [Marixanthomonas ophiurae]